MNRIFAFVLLATVAALACGQLLGSADVKNIPSVLKNKDAVATHCKCIVADDAQSKVICDPTGTKIRDTLPKAIKEGACPACTEEEKRYFALIMRTIHKDYKECYDNIAKHFGVTPEQQKKADDFMKNTPLPDGVTA